MTAASTETKRVIVAGLLALFVLAGGVEIAHAAVNINTADSAELETLPGIGPSKAAAIIEYRNTNGDFGSIGDIQNVSGIGPSTYENIKSLITVGSAESINNDDAESDTTPSSSSTERTSSTKEDAPDPVSSLTLSAPKVGYVGQVIAMSVEPKEGSNDRLVRYSWNFGDGSTSDHKSTEHTFMYAGTYTVTVQSYFLKETDVARTEIKILTPELRLVKNGTVEIHNDGEAEIDLEGYTLVSGGSSFTFPKYSYISKGGVMKLNPHTFSAIGSAVLKGPSGAVLASSSVAPAATPKGVAAGATTFYPSPQIAEATSTARVLETQQALAAETETTHLAAASGGSTRPLPYFGLFAVLALGILGLYAKRGQITQHEEI